MATIMTMFSDMIEKKITGSRPITSKETGDIYLIEHNGIKFEVYTIHACTTYHINVETISKCLSKLDIKFNGHTAKVRQTTNQHDLSKVITGILKESRRMYSMPAITIEGEIYCETEFAYTVLFAYKKGVFVDWVIGDGLPKLNETGWIYMFSGRRESDGKLIVKIGRTNDIARRFKNHKEVIDIEKCRYLSVENIRAAEKALKETIRSYNFECDKYHHESFTFNDHDTMDRFIEQVIVPSMNIAKTVEWKLDNRNPSKIRENGDFTVNVYTEVDDIEDFVEFCGAHKIEIMSI